MLSQNRSLLIIPLVLFLLLGTFLLKGLFSDPRILESGRVNQPVPNFVLPDLLNNQVVHSAESFNGKVTLFNVWGVWCPTCLAELSFLEQLKLQGVEIVGLYYEPDFKEGDDAGQVQSRIQQQVTDMLTRTGNPYQYNILDLKRDLILDLGVSGAPETFLVDKQGVIRMHHVGDINAQVWRSKIAPLYQQLLNAPVAATASPNSNDRKKVKVNGIRSAT